MIYLPGVANATASNGKRCAATRKAKAARAAFLFFAAKRYAEIEAREASLSSDAISKDRSAVMPLLNLSAAISVALAIGASPAFAAVAPSVSEELSGSPIPDIQTETIDGKPFAFSSLRGRALLVNFFASWCPACQAEQKEISQVHATYAKRGLQLVGVLLDPRETPDTVGRARNLLLRNPLPFPVVMMNESVQRGFRNQVGQFPATYFITADGHFSTILLGLQPQAQIAAQVERILPAASAGTAEEARPPSDGSEGPAEAPWKRSPWLALAPHNWREWHPVVIHFPIALLVFEALLVIFSAFRPRASLEQASRWLLTAAVVSFVPAVYTGIRDAGIDLGPGWAFWNGLQDRVRHLFLLQSTVSLHVLYALAAVIITVGRLIWRVRSSEQLLPRNQRAVFAALTILGAWALFAAGQVGGSISHP